MTVKSSFYCHLFHLKIKCGLSFAKVIINSPKSELHHANLFFANRFEECASEKEFGREC